MSSILGAAEINGIQSQGLMSQLKHFTLYNGQGGTHSVVDQRTAEELYLAPYEAAVTQGGASAVMCSYQELEITPLESSPHFACENAGILNTILRDQWGFVGPVASDYGATHSLSILQGLDQEFPTAAGFGSGPAYYGSVLQALVDPASPAYAAAMNQADAGVLYQMQRFGLLRCASAQGPIAHCSLPAQPALNESADGKTSEALAEEAAVLLQNNGNALPLTKQAWQAGVAIIGPTAALLPSSPGGERSRGVGTQNLISPLVALRTLAPEANLTYAPGVDYPGTPVPSSALRTPDGTQQGLLRTQSNSSATQIDAQIDYTASQALTPGTTYTWTGTITVPAGDTYALWLQNSAGLVNAGTAGYPVNPTGAGLGPGGEYRAQCGNRGSSGLSGPACFDWRTAQAAGWFPTGRFIAGSDKTGDAYPEPG